MTDRDGKLQALRMPGAGQAKIPRRGSGSARRWAPFWNSLQSFLPEGDGTLEEMAESPRSLHARAHLPQAFGAWMAHLFREQGLVLVDPSDDRLKRWRRPCSRRRSAKKSPVTEAVLDQTERLVARRLSSDRSSCVEDSSRSSTRSLRATRSR